jgi:hypothetical protein
MLYSQWSIGNLTPAFTGRGRRHGDAPREPRCPRSGACRCYACARAVYDIAVLNDARADLAEPIARLALRDLNDSPERYAAGWIIALTRLEQKPSYAGLEATIEYHLDSAPNPESGVMLAAAMSFYLNSLAKSEDFAHGTAARRAA